MKKLRLSLLSASLVLLASTASFAGGNYKGESYKDMPAPCPVEKGLRDGFYIGAQVGYDSYRVRENQSDTIGGVAISSNPAVNAIGFVGGVLAGYGQYVNDYLYLGAEIFINGSDAEENHSVNTYNAKVTANTAWGISFLPGYKLNNDSLLYVRLGYNQTQLKVQESTATLAGSKTNTSSGFNYGLGIETMLYQNWSVRAEYTHTNYNSFTSGGPFSSKISPSDNQGMFAVLYHFA